MFVLLRQLGGRTRGILLVGRSITYPEIFPTGVRGPLSWVSVRTFWYLNFEMHFLSTQSEF